MEGLGRTTIPAATFGAMSGRFCVFIAATASCTVPLERAAVADR